MSHQEGKFPESVWGWKDVHLLLGECDDGEASDKSYRGIAEIALAPDFFQLTSLALRRGLTSNLPPLPGLKAIPTPRHFKEAHKEGGDARPFFRGNWFSEALFKTAGTHKGKLF